MIKYISGISSKRVKIAGVLLLTIIVAVLLLRGPLMRYYAAKISERAAGEYGLTISLDRLRFSGLSGIKIDKVRVYPSSDTLFTADSVLLKLSFWKLLVFKPDVKELKAKRVKFNFVKKDSVSNFDFIYTHPHKSEDSTVTKEVVKSVNYAKLSDRFFSLILGVLPSKAKIENIEIVYIKNSYCLRVGIPIFELTANRFSTPITINEDGIESELVVQGELDDSKRKISARLFNPEKQKFTIPFLKFRWSAEVSFDTLAFETVAKRGGSEMIELQGDALGKGISVLHEKISPEPVILENGEFQFKFKVGKNFIELDSSSVVTVNKFSFSPCVRAEKNLKWHFWASINKKSFQADELFSSLPKGLFYNLEGIKTQGLLSYRFSLDLDLNNPDSLKLESVLKPEKFRIVSFGNTDFRYINTEFEYTAYEKGVAVRTFPVGPSNPNFRTLERISPLLQMAVLQSEDGGFFYHGGFLIESIRDALSEDIKTGKFRRGGSTISMQLAKNLFLSRHKTLARKFEEIMIVWLMETNRLSSKERMFEIYLNIIEWGPMVYGANEASRFYFDKDVKDININEAIFLASIIPSPKRALYSFDENYQLKPSLEGYYRLLAGRFRVKGLINEQEEANIRPVVTLGSQAKRLIKERDTSFRREISSNHY